MTTKLSTANLDSSITTLIVAGSSPKVTAITYPGNDLAADTAGGQTITLTGTSFVSGCSVFIGTTQASVVTVISATSVTFTSPALAAATYTLYLVNPDGGTATIVPGISYSGTPAWTTAAGSLGSAYEYSAISNTVAATGDGSITYSVLSGTLPTGSSLNTSTGVISGTSPVSAGATTYTFVIRATDAQLQDTDRSFSITVNTDVVTWSTPAANSTVTLGKDAASSTALLATSAAGNAITYTSTTLPAGLTISGATVTGTPTVVATTAVTFTATAADTSRITTAVINWAVTVSGDTYFPYTTLLLSGGTSTSTFIADASTNNFALAIAGDTKPNNFNPYTPGYYSNYFDSTGDYLSTTVNLAIATEPFTMEAWVNLSALGTERTILNNLYWQNGNNGGWYLTTDSTNRVWLRASTNTFNSRPTIILSSSTLAANTWTHVAVVRDSNNLVSMYFNGVSAATSVTYAASLNQGTGQLFRIGAWTPDGGSQDLWSGYISNARVVVGTAVYTGTFTPSTTPLTAIANTVLLTCQSNRFVDNSTNAYAITKVGDTTVSPATPFVPNTAYAAYGSTYFDGTGDYLVTPSSSAFNFGTGDFQIEAWVYLFNVTDRRFIYGTGGTGQQNQFWIETDRKVGYYDGTADRYSTGTIQLNSWNQVALARSGSTCTFYVNGVASGTFTSSASLGATSQAYIGRRSDALYEVAGYISDLRILKGVTSAPSGNPTSPLSAITGTSLLTLQTNQPVNNSVFLDSSTNALAVTRGGNTSAGTFSPYGVNWSTYFGGSGNYLTAPTTAQSALNFSTGCSIEGWSYLTTFNANYGFIFDTYQGAGSFVGWWFVGHDPSGYWRISPGDALAVVTGTLMTLNVWNHWAITNNGTRTRLFVNGVLIYTNLVTPQNVNQYFVVSTYGGGNYNQYTVTGYLSNMRFIKDSSNIPASYVTASITVGTTIFTPSTDPLTSVTGTGLLLFDRNRMIDSSSNNFAITVTGSLPVQRFSPFSPSAAYSTSTIGGSGYFNGTGDHLTAANNSAFSFGTGNFTIEGWVYKLNAANASFIDTRTSAGGVGPWAFYVDASNFPYFYSGTSYTSSIAITLNAWNHIVATRSGSTLQIFVNGVQGYTGTVTTNMDRSGTIYIGVINNPAAFSAYWFGYMANMRIVKGTAVYTSAFTPPTAPLTAITNTSLLLNYTNAGIIDNTMINNLETVGDAKILSTQTPYAGSYYSNYFDGTGDYLSVASNVAFTFGTGDFTIEGWFYFTNNNGALQTVWAFRSTTVSMGSPCLVLDGSFNITLYMTDSVGSWAAPNVTTGLVASLNQWQHIALVRSGNTHTVYKNGVAGTPYTYSTSHAIGGGLSLMSGSYAGGQEVQGYVSNFRMVKGTAVYTGTFTPSTTPLTATQSSGTNISAITGTATSLLTCQSNRFVDNSVNAIAITKYDNASVQSFNPFQRNSAATLYFDGTGDYLYSPPNTTYAMGSGDFTIEFWYYPVSQNAAWNPNIMGNYNTTWTTNKWAIHAPHSTAAGKYSFWVNNIATQPLLASTSNVTNGAWVHIAITRSASTWRMFINGSIQATATSSAALDGGTAASMDGLYIGANFYSGEGGRYINAYINDLRITKGTARYTSTFTPPTTAFTAR